MKGFGRVVSTAAAVKIAAACTGAYLKWLRPWQMTWGATPEEVARVYPYDDAFERPEWNATRAVTVEARPEQIWPFLVQIG